MSRGPLLKRPLLTGLAVLASCGQGHSMSDAGAPDSGQNCPAYCAAIHLNCTGPNLQFSTNDRCLNACATYPVGSASDTSGDTLGCRLHEVAAAHSDPDPHCVNAGPGGNGVCGTNCDGYCQITQTY